jgi:hypothetical protein
MEQQTEEEMCEFLTDTAKYVLNELGFMTLTPLNLHNAQSEYSYEQCRQFVQDYYASEE